MTRFATSLALAAVFAASSALAQADPHAGHRPDSAAAQAAPAKPEAAAPADGGCKMMKGMMGDKSAAPSDGTAKGEDGQKSAAEGMKCMSRTRSAANDDHAHDQPATKAK